MIIKIEPKVIIKIYAFSLIYNASFFLISNWIEVKIIFRNIKIRVGNKNYLPDHPREMISSCRNIEIYNVHRINIRFLTSL